MARPDKTKEYSPVPHDYNNTIEGTYSDPKFIYNYTGYQNHEIYRFGIVYLMSNGTLSPVFNIIFTASFVTKFVVSSPP